MKVTNFYVAFIASGSVYKGTQAQRSHESVYTKITTNVGNNHVLQKTEIDEISPEICKAFLTPIHIAACIDMYANENHILKECNQVCESYARINFSFVEHAKLLDHAGFDGSEIRSSIRNSEWSKAKCVAYCQEQEHAQQIISRMETSSVESPDL